MKAQQLPVAIAEKAGFSIIVGDAIIGMAGRMELAADTARVGVFHDRIDDASATSRGIGPRQRPPLGYGEVDGADGIAHRRFVGDAVGGHWRLRDCVGRAGPVNLDGAQNVHATGNATGQAEERNASDHQNAGPCPQILSLNCRVCRDAHHVSPSVQYRG